MSPSVGVDGPHDRAGRELERQADRFRHLGERFVQAHERSHDSLLTKAIDNRDETRSGGLEPRPATPEALALSSTRAMATRTSRAGNDVVPSSMRRRPRHQRCCAAPMAPAAWTVWHA